jgi:hypothetical protein
MWRVVQEKSYSQNVKALNVSLLHNTLLACASADTNLS